MDQKTLGTTICDTKDVGDIHTLGGWDASGTLLGGSQDVYHILLLDQRTPGVTFVGSDVVRVG